MCSSVHITIVTSLLGRCSFVESPKGIMLNIFSESERICLFICIIVEQQCVYVLIVFICFNVVYES